jgi:hypothetical protein
MLGYLFRSNWALRWSAAALRPETKYPQIKESGYFFSLFHHTRRRIEELFYSTKEEIFNLSPTERHQALFAGFI